MACDGRGAFKFRGACNAVFSLPEEEASKGVITHSSGNHAGALALAAQLRGIPCTVITPQGTLLCKLSAIRSACIQLLKNSYPNLISHPFVYIVRYCRPLEFVAEP